MHFKESKEVLLIEVSLLWDTLSPQSRSFGMYYCNMTKNNNLYNIYIKNSKYFLKILFLLKNPTFIINNFLKYGICDLPLIKLLFELLDQKCNFFNSWLLSLVSLVYVAMAEVAYGKWDVINNGAYKLVRKIGSGSFGTIYLGLNTKTGEVS